MRKYIKLLAKLSPKNSIFDANKQYVYLLSGQSDYSHSELSKGQKKLLKYISNYGYTPIYTGFPFNKGHDYKNCKRANLFIASLRNIQQFIYITFSMLYRLLIIKHIAIALKSSRKSIIVCQSSGLHILNCILPLVNINNKHIVIALGPVSTHKFTNKNFSTYVIKGNKDWISRCLDKNQTTHYVNCNHFNYFDCPDILKIIEEIL